MRQQNAYENYYVKWSLGSFRGVSAYSWGSVSKALSRGPALRAGKRPDDSFQPGTGKVTENHRRSGLQGMIRKAHEPQTVWCLNSIYRTKLLPSFASRAPEMRHKGGPLIPSSDPSDPFPSLSFMLDCHLCIRAAAIKATWADLPVPEARSCHVQAVCPSGYANIPIPSEAPRGLGLESLLWSSSEVIRTPRGNLRSNRHNDQSTCRSSAGTTTGRPSLVY